MIRVSIHWLMAISVLGFLSSTAVSQQFNGVESKNVDKYVKYAESLITRYDEDKDGKLNETESKKMRRPPAGADVNDDGFITKAELIGSLSGTNKPPSSSRTSDDAPGSRPQSNSSAQPNYAKFEKYAESLLTRYDKDKDGKLNEAESKKMRQLPAGADVNEDGLITEAELVGYLLLSKYDSNKDGTLSRAELVESLKKPMNPRPKNDGGVAPGSSPNSFRSSSRAKYEKYVDSLLNQYDEDRDGQLSQEEQRKMRRPPSEADINNDGLVSRDEWINYLSDVSSNRLSPGPKTDPAKGQTDNSGFWKFTSRLIMALLFFF